ncbi:MAG: AIM24 family protein [Bryobacterales bacterium]|nr:AIM24 family protein [Bryobacterales bacterium]
MPAPRAVPPQFNAPPQPQAPPQFNGPPQFNAPPAGYANQAAPPQRVPAPAATAPVPGAPTPQARTGKVLTKSRASYGTAFEVFEYEMHRMARITLQGTSVSVEAGLLHYWVGQIQMQTAAPSLGGMAKSFLTKEKVVRPVYSGVGEVYLEPTFGEIEFLELDGQQMWILDRGSFLACDQGVQLGMYTNPMFQSFFGGEGMFQTQVSGTGKVMFTAPGPLERVDLRGQTLAVDGSFAVARTGSVEFRVEKATKGVFRSMMSGEGMVNVFTGQGTVLLAPIPNRHITIMGQFGSLYSAIRSISRS